MSQAAQPRSPSAFGHQRDKSPGQGQDSFAAFEMLQACGIVVCDGVGSKPNSGDVSEAATTAAKALLQEHGWADDLVSRVNDQVSQFEARSTTLLAATGRSTDGGWLIDYAAVGNGSVIEIAAGDGHLNPWMWWTDHFVPQVDFSTGKDTLTGALPCHSDELTWTSGRIRAPYGPARVLLLCSDGIASVENYRTGRMPDGSAWREIPDVLDALLTAARQPLLDAAVETGTARRLAQALAGTLDEFARAGRLDDDATFAALVLPPVVSPNHDTAERSPDGDEADSNPPASTGPAPGQAAPHVQDF
jgi:serine/threonine protein phosphatase PrpC